ncbi:hypothetical protein MMC14_000789 [Varicellaria rhodocarpa]|nr:hypothetical protein [Varicellaria rhodocarpa]
MSSMVSADLDMMHTSKSTNRTHKGWFNIEAADYLARGGAHLGLRGKLHAYLKSQGEISSDYPLAYLVTAPRFLGYSFNPVSFWYLYDLNQQLKAMVLEVNNTFDERRMYFLKNSNEDTEPPPKADELSKKPDLPPQPSDPVKLPAKFSNTWRKDFHVSPFNSRKGTYGLSALDPFAPDLTKPGSINNSITLSSSKDHAKLVARIFSTEPSIDPSTMSLRQKIQFITSWWWVGFVTFPRIVKEAGNLFFRRKLHVWYRPEVSRESVGRKETDRERIIEAHFRNFLKSRIEHSSLPFFLNYTSCCSTSLQEEEDIFRPSSSTYSPILPTIITFQILTPLFYTRLIHYAHISEFFSSELLKNDDDKDRTFWTSAPEKLLQIFNKNEKKEGNDKDRQQRTPGSTSNDINTGTDDSFFLKKLSPFDRARWKLLCYLRHSSPKTRTTTTTITKKDTPPTISNNRNNKPIPATIPSTPNHNHNHHIPFSPLDQYVLSHYHYHHHSREPNQARAYRRAVTAILASEYVAFSMPEVFDALDTVVRMALCYVAARAAMGWLETLGSRCLDVDFWRVVVVSNAVHGWWVFKEVL